MKIEKIVLSQIELQEHLKEQIKFLLASGESYDNGFDGEAKRMAVAIRVLVHDTKNSCSLLGQLGLKERDFLSTCMDYDPLSATPHGGLVYIYTASKEPKYIAMLDDSGTQKHIPFEEWWNEIVFVDSNKGMLTRKDIILTAADQDGGAHVDPKLDETYARLSRQNSMGWILTNGSQSIPLEHPERTAIRQITHELLKTLIPDYTKKPQLIGNGVIIGGLKVITGPPKDTVPKVGRNEKCPCGSGIKYKKCHGKVI